MRPLRDTRQSGDATLRLWECTVCNGRAWHGYRNGHQIIEQAPTMTDQGPVCG